MQTKQFKANQGLKELLKIKNSTSLLKIKLQFCHYSSDFYYILLELIRLSTYGLAK